MVYFQVMLLPANAVPSTIGSFATAASALTVAPLLLKLFKFPSRVVAAPAAKHIADGATDFRRIPGVQPVPALFDVTSGRDITATAASVPYGLTESGYAPIITNGLRSRHLLVTVIRLLNLRPCPILLRNPYVYFEFGDGAGKKVFPASYAAVARLQFARSGGGADRFYDNLQSSFQTALLEKPTFNKTSLEIGARTTVITYSAFVPEGLAGLPFFEGNALLFSVGFQIGDNGYRFNGFRAVPFRGVGVRSL